MELLSTFQYNNSRKLFDLAQQLNSNNFFEAFLTEQQYQVFNHILKTNNHDLWDHFLEGNCSVLISDRPESLDETKQNEDTQGQEQGELTDETSKNEKNDDSKSTENGGEVELPFEEGPRMIKSLSLHIRYLLWEKAIDFYYSSKELENSAYASEESCEDYELLASLQDSNEESENQEEKVPEQKVRDEEDDYDDEEEEEDMKVDEEKNTPQELQFNEDNTVKLEIPFSAFNTSLPRDSTATEVASPTKLDDNENSEAQKVEASHEYEQEVSKRAHEDQERLIKELNKVYHSFEYDKETLIKRRKLEKSDLKLEKTKDSGSTATEADANSMSEEPLASSSSNVDMGISLGAASTSLQRLLGTIQQKRDEVPLNDTELRSLFMDVRKNRGKWANDERIGQEELYEACEKVVLELRGYTEHSTPFLNKVSKREAPNYGLIIKKPMDLNMVMKKLKSLSYNSKQEFVDDLNLIWSNCLTYNADPKHFIRVHAHAMQKKTAKLIPSIPNITIRSRAELEKEEEEAELRQATPLTGSATGATTTLGATGGKSMTKGRKRSRQDNVKTEPDPSSSALSEDTSVAATPEVKENSVPAPLVTADSTANVSNDEEDEDEEDADALTGDNAIASGNVAGNEDSEENEFDPDLQAWRSLTAKSRANYCAQRAALFDEKHHLKSNAVAILRKRNSMQNFNLYLQNSSVVSKSSNLLENDEPYLFEYDVTGGLPGMTYHGIDETKEEKREQKLADLLLQQVDGDASKFKSGFVLPTDSGLNKIYFENITEIQEIRKICFKISLIRQMQTQQFVHHTQMKQPEVDAIREVDIDSASNLPNRDPFNKEVQFSVLRRNISKIAMQTGFETAEPFAINTLTQLAEKYMGNLIRSMKLHSETNSANRLSTRDILLLSLLENGINKPDDLYTFVKERVLKQHDKLVSLRENLSNFLKDLLRPGLDNFNERNFEDNSEQFITGDFSNDLGDDFFGFKLLGLDKEYKMMSSSIPIYLLHSRLHNSYSSTGSASKLNKHEDLKDYVTYSLVASDLDQQVGLLKPFYTELYDKSKAHFIKNQKKKGESTELPESSSFLLVEDDELPQKQRNIRPRLPPTGRITSVKKKIVANSFFIPEDKHDGTDLHVDKNGASFLDDEEELRALESQLKSEDEPLILFTSPKKSQIGGKTIPSNN